MRLRLGTVPPRELAARIAAIVILATLALALGRLYVGHSSSPYGVCYGDSGREIPCAVATRAK